MPPSPMQHFSAATRGETRIGWLTSYHSFSFGDYRDPARMRFGNLRVINDDVIAGGGGFAPHGHHDMEIVTIVLSGALAHKDSLGSGAEIHPGDVQRMSAGDGITHSEYNASADAPVHLLQIWIMPAQRGGKPSYAQKHFTEQDYAGRFALVVSGDGRDGSVPIKQDMDLYRARLDEGAALEWPANAERQFYLHVATGTVTVNGVAYNAGDALGMDGAEKLDIRAAAASDVLLFDQPVWA